MIKKIHLIYLFFISTLVFTQNKKIDSLSNLFNLSRIISPNDIDLVNTFIKQQSVEGNRDSLITLAKKTLLFSQQLKYQKGICYANNLLGVIHYSYNNRGKVMDYFKDALTLSKLIKDKKIEAEILKNIGNVYFNENNNKTALIFYMKSLRIREEINDKEGIAGSLNNVGIVYDNYVDDNKALQYFTKALKLYTELKDNRGICRTMSNIAVIYKRKDIDSSIYFNKQIIKIKLANNYIKDLHLSYNNLGTCYLQLKKYQEALKYLKLSLEVNEKIKNKAGCALAEHNIAQGFFGLNQIDSAKIYAERCLKSSQESHSLYIESIACKFLVELCLLKKNYKAAFEFQEQFQKLNDSIYNIESKKVVNEINIKYETEKKENENKILNIQNKIKSLQIRQQQQALNNQRLLFFFLLLVVILIIVAGLLLISRNKIKQKNILKTQLLKQQETRTSTIIETQELERKRIAQDLHDGIGQTLASIKLNFIQITDELNSNSVESKAKINQTIASLDDAYKEVRTLSHQMMPKSLQDVGIVGAIDDLLERTLSNLSINYVFEKITDIKLNDADTIGLYRIFQELLNNILKHAKATQITVHLYNTKTHTVLMVEDNGIGIDNTTKKTGIGLANIEARAHSLGGTFTLNQGEKTGTIAVIRILT